MADLPAALKSIQDALNITPETDDEGTFDEFTRMLRPIFGFDTVLFSEGREFLEQGFDSKDDLNHYLEIVKPSLDRIRPVPENDPYQGTDQFDLSSSFDESFDFVYCPDTMESDEYRNLFDLFGYRSMLFLPIRFKFRFPVKERVVFDDVDEVAIFNSRAPGAFFDDDIKLLYAITNLLYSRFSVTMLTKVISTYFNSSINNSPLGILIITTDDRVILANDMVVQILGLEDTTRKHVISGIPKKPMIDGLDVLFPNARTDGLHRAVSRIRETGELQAKLQFWHEHPLTTRRRLIRALFYKLVEKKDSLGGGGNLDIGIAIDDITDEYEQHQLHRELEIARDVQRSLLPGEHFENDRIETFGATYPAREVGGDYYDLILHDHRLHFAIADVCGKGISAAMVMSSLKTSLQNLIETDTEFHHIVPHLNSTIFRNTPTEIFITMFLGRIDLESHEMVYCNCGHFYPILRSGDEFAFLEIGGPVLGAFPDIPYETGKLRLNGGDTILCYTDGIIEAENRRGEQFEEDRVLETLRTMTTPSSRRLVEEIVENVGEFRGNAPQADDITVLSIRMKR